MRRLTCEHDSENACGPCRIARRRAQGNACYDRNREDRNERDRLRYPERKTTLQAQRAERRATRTDEEKAADAAYMRDWKRRQKLNNPRAYFAAQGIFYPETIEPDDLKVFQRGICPGCSTTDEELVNDHDHDIVDAPNMRGLTCNRCNLCIGHAGNSPTTLRRLADYLENTPVQQMLRAGEQLEFDFGDYRRVS